MFEIKIFTLNLPLKIPFTIAHGSYSYRNNIFLEIRKGEKVGYGEAPIVPYYDGTVKEVLSDLRKTLSKVSVSEIERCLTLQKLSDFPSFTYPVSSCAFQEAILHLASQLQESTISTLLNVPDGNKSFETTFTIAFDENIERMVTTAVNSNFTRLKIKCGIPGDVERVKKIREALPDAQLFIDANQGWSFEQAQRNVRELEKVGVVLIEEPFGSQHENLERLAISTSIPIVVDESVVNEVQLGEYLSRVPHLGGLVVKHAKCGGPLATRSLIEKGQQAHLKIFLSSMVESSIGLYSAVALAPLANYIDLDAPLLLADKNIKGVVYNGGKIALDPTGIRVSEFVLGMLQKIPAIVVEV